MAVPGFVTDLTRFADSLRSEPVEARKGQLRAHLAHLNQTLLEDGQVLYLPAAGFSNRCVTAPQLRLWVCGRRDWDRVSPPPPPLPLKARPPRAGGVVLL